MFVIGAGCSREYGLPVGEELKDKIADLLDHARRWGSSNTSGGDETFIGALNVLGGSNWGPWLTAAAAMADGVRHANSIDRFLHIHRNDSRFIDIGKLAIANIIAKAERNSTLRAQKDGRLDLNVIKATTEHHWLSELFARMQDDSDRDTLETIFNNVVFVCFNYDRCVEQYFWHAIRSLGNYSEERAAEALAHLKIYHPYGVIGRLPWQAAKTRQTEHPFPYANDISSPHNLVAISKGIRTFTEQVEDGDELLAVREHIRSAQQLVFMGFSFLPQNMELLTSDAPASATEVFATVYEESTANQRIFRRQIASLLKGRNPSAPSDIKPKLEADKAGKFIRAWGNRLRS